MDVFTDCDSAPAPRSRSRNFLHWLVVLVALLVAVAACGASKAPRPIAGDPSQSASNIPDYIGPGSTTGPSPSVATGLDTSYCDPLDTPIPQGTGAHLTATEIYWWQMQATVVPACSEIEGDPPQTQTKNMTNGLMGDKALAAWEAADNETWTLTEWGQQHSQGRFIQYLEGGRGSELVRFVKAGGKIIDSPSCEYAEKVVVVSVTAAEMAQLSPVSSADVVFVAAATGPCTSIWTAANGSVTNQNLRSGQEERVLLVTTLGSNPAIGEFAIQDAEYDQGVNEVADSIILQSGI